MLFLLGLLLQSAEACTCVGGIPACQSVWQASGVVEATVSSIEIVTGPPVMPNGPRYSERRVQLQNVRTWVGDSTDVVVTGMGGGDCGYDFQVGTRYLIVTYNRQPDGKTTTGICSLTQPAHSPGPLKSYLDTLSKPGPGSSVSGTVFLTRGLLDPIGRSQPLAGVRIVVSGPTQRVGETGIDGKFAIEGLPPGEYSVTPQLPTNRDELAPLRASTVKLPNAHSCAAVWITTAINGQVVGTVVDQSGRAVKGAVMNIRVANPIVLARTQYLSAESDETGTFSFDRLPAGSYTVGVNIRLGPTAASPFAPAYGALASGSTPEVIELAPGARQRLPPIVVRRLEPVTVNGQVRFEDGAAAAKAIVRLSGSAEQRTELLQAIVTSDTGEFSIELHVGMRYTIEARFDRGSSEPVEISPGTAGDPIVVLLARRRD